MLTANSFNISENVSTLLLEQVIQSRLLAPHFQVRVREFILIFLKTKLSSVFGQGPCSGNFYSTCCESPMNLSEFTFPTEMHCLINLFLTLCCTVPCQFPSLSTTNETSSYSNLSRPKHVPFFFLKKIY